MRSVRNSWGFGPSEWHVLVCLLLIVVVPLALWADDTGAAILRSNGGVMVNKTAAPAASALFPDDLIETQKNIVARIEATGSTADISPETMVQFESDELVLDHGSVSVNTSRGLRVRVGCVLVTPANPVWTHYDVTDVNGKVIVSALKSDVNIDSRSTGSHQVNSRSAKPATRSDRVTVREGEQKSREEKCGAPVLKESGKFAARGAILNSPWVIGLGAGTIIGGTCWVLCWHNDDPMSPSKPSNP
jgi:hypothetical protein